MIMFRLRRRLKQFFCWMFGGHEMVYGYCVFCYRPQRKDNLFHGHGKKIRAR